jgi:hypothetical protein
MSTLIVGRRSLVTISLHLQFLVAYESVQLFLSLGAIPLWGFHIHRCPLIQVIAFST